MIATLIGVVGLVVIGLGGGVVVALLAMEGAGWDRD